MSFRIKLDMAIYPVCSSQARARVFSSQPLQQSESVFVAFCPGPPCSILFFLTPVSSTSGYLRKRPLIYLMPSAELSPLDIYGAIIWPVLGSTLQSPPARDAAVRPRQPIRGQSRGRVTNQKPGILRHPPPWLPPLSSPQSDAETQTRHIRWGSSCVSVVTNSKRSNTEDIRVL